ncbi:hypothetical protein HDU96_005153 [Phlyctochytrium bullatum]|nr:hypothetical protein HDU96_005153 [Phlyctochytrium bullatum]
MEAEKEASPAPHAIQHRLLSPFVSRYVRRQLKSLDPAKWERIRGCLESGRAFAEEAFLAVVMIDISGYSKLTSELSTLGRLASEVITKSLGQYLDKVIHVVGQFNGDVIKFLGDALLISFEADPETQHHSDSEANVVLTALHFLVTVMTSLPTAVFDMNPFSDAAMAMLESSTESTRVLRLHSALWCGRATHVIAGLVEERLDYFIAGEFASAIEAALNLAKRDEIGISPSVAEVVEETLGINFNRTNRASYATVDNRDIVTLHQLLGQRRGHGCLTSSPYIEFPQVLPNVVNVSPQRDVETSRLFVNDAMVYKIRSISSNASQQQSSDISSGVDMGDYRTVVVVFVKLVDLAFSLDAVQEALVAFLSCVRRFRGVFQQVAVDDKGTTLLAAFGLPPLTEEANALNAIHSLMAFGEIGEESKFGNFVAGVSSGDLLFTRIGNDYRSEASFVGDAICTAARLMSFSTQKNVVVFDNTIKPFLPTRYPIESLGGVKLKGKPCEIDLFQIRLSVGDATVKMRPSLGGNPNASVETAKVRYGYKKERETLKETIVNWIEWHKEGGDESRKPCVACAIVGPMGSGKSSFLESTISLLRERGAETCFTFGTELRYLTPLYALKNILIFIYESFGRRLATEQANSLSTLGESNHVLRRPRSQISIGLLNQADNREVLRRFMEKYDLNQELTPMLRVLLGHETSEKYGQTLLSVKKTAVIERDAIKVVTVAIVNRFTLSEPTCFIIEDLQGFFLFTVRSTNGREVEKLLEVQSLSKIELKGMARHDIETIFLTGLREMGVKSIHSSIADELLERCEGMPLKASLMVQAILQSKEVFTVRYGCLITIGTPDTIDRLFSASVGTFILAEFDRLQPDCKEVLKKASILGPQFLAEQIQGLDPELTSEALASLLREARKAKFLREQYGLDWEEEYAFRHVSLRNAIYESIPFTVRQRLHLLAAKFFERQCNDFNKRSLWPIICHHLNQAKEFEQSHSKMIDSLLIREKLFNSAYDIISELIKHTLLNKDMLSGNSDWKLLQFRIPLSQITIARILAMLAVCSSTIGNSANEVQELSFLALDASGFPWPRTPQEGTRAILKGIWMHYKLVRMTHKGKKALSLSAQNPFRLHCESLLLAYEALFYVFYYKSSAQTWESLLLALQAFNVSIANADIVPEHFLRCCFQAAFIVSQAGPIPSSVSRKLSNAYMKAAGERGFRLKVDYRKRPLYGELGFACVVRGEYQKALDALTHYCE